MEERTIFCITESFWLISDWFSNLNNYLITEAALGFFVQFSAKRHFFVSVHVFWTILEPWRSSCYSNLRLFSRTFCGRNVLTQSFAAKKFWNQTSVAAVYLEIPWGENMEEIFTPNHCCRSWFRFCYETDSLWQNCFLPTWPRFQYEFWWVINLQIWFLITQFIAPFVSPN